MGIWLSLYIILWQKVTWDSWQEKISVIVIRPHTYTSYLKQDYKSYIQIFLLILYIWSIGPYAISPITPQIDWYLFKLSYRISWSWCFNSCFVINCKSGFPFWLVHFSCVVPNNRWKCKCVVFINCLISLY